MRILFFLSMSGAAITFALFYTWCIQKPVMTVMRFFQGEDLPEEAPYGETEKLPPAVLPLVWYPMRIVFFFGETYILAAWGAYCILRTLEAMQKAGIEKGPAFHVPAFIACVGALGYLARKEPRKDILTIIQSCIGMGSYLVFVLNRAALMTYYPWLVDFFAK